MDKIIAKSGYVKAFKHHMSYFVQRGIIAQEQADAMIALIDRKPIKFISIVTIIGALLTGLGILLYIASNWDHFSEGIKITLILAGMCGFFAVGLRIEPQYKNTGKAFIYISVLIFGGGLFLIDQIFNLNISVENHFLLWIVGILPMVYILKDYLIFIFVQALGISYVWLMFVEGWSYELGKNSISMAIAVGLLIILIKFNEDQMRSKLSVFLNHILMIAIMLYFADVFDLNPLLQVIMVFGFGLYVLYMPVFGKFADNVNYIQGTVIIGVTGIILTYEDLWEELSYIKDGTWFAICFGILFAIYLFWLTKQGNLISLVLICLLILRYYTDTFYDFLPKSIFFIVGGLILIGFGFYLERLTRMRGGLLDVKKDR